MSIIRAAIYYNIHSTWYTPDNPLGAEHSSEGTDHSSEGGSSTASLIGENANDVQSSTEQEENERRGNQIAV